MPCKVCHASNVVSIGGIDYCAECSTQTEDTQVEVSEAESSYSWRSSIRSSSPSARKESQAKEKLYAPWITTEAYNIILWKQVSSLIELGASKNLKAAVLHIWAQYLQKCEIAFRKDYRAAEEVPRLGPLPQRRDIKVLYGSNLAYLKKKCYGGKPIKQKEPKKKVVKETSEPESSNAEDTFDVHNAEVSFNGSSISNANVTDDNSETCENESSFIEPLKEKGLKAKYSSHARYLKKRKSLNKCRSETLVSQMTLSKTLCFCYLGLIYTEDQFTLSDVIRFANEGRIPYFNAADCLPSTMKLQYFDHICFTKHTNPDLCKLSMMCAKLVQFLDLPSFKHRSLLPLVCRYIKDLNLPSDMIPIVKNLLVKFSEHDAEWFKKPPNMRARCFPIPVYENRALAFIIIVLKMLFVLDGNFEKDHSNVMMKINALSQGNKYFLWNEWYQHSAVKEYLFIAEKISYPRLRRIDCLSAEQIISNHPISELKPPYDDASVNKKNKLAAKFSIKDLLFKVAEISKEEPKTPTVFPLKSEVKHFLSMWENMAAYKDNDGSSFAILSEDFSSLSLDYDMSFTESAEDIESLLISSLYKSIRSMSVGYSSVTCEEMITTTSKYWFKNYTRHDSLNKTEFFNKLPSTFCWLLSFLSRYICTEIGDLYSEVVRIEKILFFGKSKFFK